MTQPVHRKKHKGGRLPNGEPPPEHPFVRDAASQRVTGAAATTHGTQSQRSMDGFGVVEALISERWEDAAPSFTVLQAERLWRR